MRFTLPAAVCVLAACLGAAGAWAQTSGEGTLGGQVLGTDGKAAVGARVTLQPSDGRRAHTTETNDEGHFWFPSLPRGLYDVRAFHDGRWSDWRRNVWVERGKQSNVTLRLRPKKPVPANSLSALPNQ
jgi:Carboxypeptidase regulatory-like domain